MPAFSADIGDFSGGRASERAPNERIRTHGNLRIVIDLVTTKYYWIALLTANFLPDLEYRIGCPPY